MSFLASPIRSTILVTGGGSGIGLALAKRLSNRGHEVIVVGRNQQKLDRAKEECPELTTFHGDVSTDYGRLAIRDRINSDFPNLNVLINNAGENITVPPLWKSTEDDWAVHKKVLATNLDAPMHLSMLCLPNLMKQPHALIMNVSAIVAFAPLATAPSYSAAKGKLIVLLNFIQSDFLVLYVGLDSGSPFFFIEFAASIEAIKRWGC